ncbi:hypothetical protein [Streptomyces sp. KR55]|uniref:hypothetical protein n=1 Tax=Streptomyces sp. KR55 TaxID=3457425 RepID=UPI003FD6A9F1
MTVQLPIFTDCPYDGCEDGYCACLEQDLDPDDFDGSYEDLDPEDLELLEALESGAELMFTRGRLRVVETVPISIDTYEPLQGT